MAAFVIGIAGGSASGKSTLAQQLRDRLAPLRVSIMNQDRYFHSDQQMPRHASPDGARVWPDHNHPDSFDFACLRSDLETAREGPDDVVIVEGILVLHASELRELMDVRLFVEADADERIVRRIRRNLARGLGIDEICDFYLESVRFRHREFCEPTREHADLVIPGGQHKVAEAGSLLDRVCQQVRAAAAGAERQSPGRT